jgi:hypothetical protein
MSYSFVFSGNTSELSASFNPSIYLEDGNYEIGLTNFETFHAIPNIDEKNHFFKIGNYTITIPTGAYELTDIESYLQKELQSDNIDFSMIANNNTLHVTFFSSQPVTFDSGTIGNILGFDEGIYKANEFHTSQKPAEIIKVNALLVDCSIADGSYLNGYRGHIIHQFFPSVSPGFKIIETPQNIIYFPVNVKIISNISLRVIDQDGDLVNFSGETITVRLHLRKSNE